MGSMHQEPFDGNLSYAGMLAALITSEEAISEVLHEHYKRHCTLTHADLFGMGIARRALALSSGFRLLVEHQNSLCALPTVRMQLDTALRLYAGFFVADHQAFCRDVIKGTQIDKLKADDGKKMRDSYLVERVASKNPWMSSVYKFTSGYIHFSNRHIQEALRIGDDGKGQMIISRNDMDRKPEHFLEPMRCLHHLNSIIEFALKDWFARMCNPAGVIVSAEELWGKNI